jgi:hypothetical protein
MVAAGALARQAGKPARVEAGLAIAAQILHPHRSRGRAARAAAGASFIFMQTLLAMS